MFEFYYVELIRSLGVVQTVKILRMFSCSNNALLENERMFHLNSSSFAFVDDIFQSCCGVSMITTQYFKTLQNAVATQITNATTGTNPIAAVTAAAAPTVAPAPPPAAVAKPANDNTKEKCRKFLANLLELSSREPKPVERNVRTLIQDLIDMKVEPEDFCDRLEKLLNASPQPCLIGFLKVSY